MTVVIRAKSKLTPTLELYEYSNVKPSSILLQTVFEISLIIYLLRFPFPPFYLMYKVKNSKFILKGYIHENH